jgi:hypothetical protein
LAPPINDRQLAAPLAGFSDVCNVAHLLRMMLSLPRQIGRLKGIVVDLRPEMEE